MTMKSDANFKGKVTYGLKNDIRNLVNFHASSRKSEKLYFDVFLLSKIYKDLDEKVQKSYLSWHWIVMQSLKKTWLSNPKNNMRNLVKSHASSRRAPFVQSIKSFRWKSTEELCLMTLNSDAKFGEKLTLDSKNDMRNLVNFNANSGKSENVHFNVLLLSKVCYAWAKKVQRRMNNDAKFEEKLIFALKNGMRNLANFEPTLESLKICTLMGSFWPKYIMSELKNYRGVMCHDAKGWSNI